jgi:hypothetical protein
VDFGFSYLPAVSSIPVIGGSYLVGGDLKICLSHPEEGVTWAIRTSYNVNHLQIEGVTIHTTTISPQLVVSKQLNFADPYVGTGFQYATGYVNAAFNLPALASPGPTLSTIHLQEKGIGFGAVFFGGLSLKVPNVGFRLTLEGAYSSAQVSYLGTKIGFSF